MPVVGYATQQEPDLIIFNKECLTLRSFPLEMIFYVTEKATERRIFTPPFGHRPNGLPTLYSGSGFSERSSNWRGYTATWLIENNQLYLIGISASVYISKPIKSGKDILDKFSDNKNWISARLSDIRPSSKNADKVFADWYIGELLILKGGIGPENKYQFEIRILLRNGIVQSINTTENWRLPTSDDLKQGQPKQLQFKLH